MSFITSRYRVIISAGTTEFSFVWAKKNVDEDITESNCWVKP